MLPKKSYYFPFLGFVNKDIEYDIRGNSKIPFSLSTVDPFTIVFEYECIT